MDREADFRFREGPINYSLSWILLTFLGVFGIHRMYMGKCLTGLLYLCTGGLFFIGVLFYTLFRGKKVTENNPWNEYADTLEWTLPCPPPEHTFEQLPKQSDWDKVHAH